MIDALRTILGFLPQDDRRKFYILMGMIAVMGVADLVGVAAILPFLAVVADPTLIETNRVFSTLWQLTGSGDERTFLLWLGIAVFVVILSSLAIKAATVYAIARFSHMRKFRISDRLFSGYLRQPYTWFLDRHGSKLAKTVLYEVDRAVMNSMVPALMILAQVTSITFIGILLLIVAPVMALSAILLIGAVYGLIFVFVRTRLTVLGKRHVEANTLRFKAAHEALGGIKEVKVEGLEEPFLVRFRKPTFEIAQISTQTQVISQMPRFALEAAVFGGLLATVLVFLGGAGPGALEAFLPKLGLFAAAGLRMFPAVQQAYHYVSQMRAGRAVLDEVAEALSEVDSRPWEPAPRPAPMGLKDSFSLEGVHFGYPTSPRPVLDGLDLTIPARTTVGLVGGTGAGKTTAVDLMLGLLVPDEGALVVDGTRIDGSNRRAWQASIGYVPQAIYLIDESVAANIAFGVPKHEIDMDAVVRAAKLAALHDFVLTELSEGYDTVVGERGVRLSGGQRQRIGIARALYRDPDVLILDEATSALDNLTERAVMDAVSNLGGVKTVVMIAHRLSTVKGCDRIFLMERGQVAAVGSYDALIEENDTFREMAEAS